MSDTQVTKKEEKMKEVIGMVLFLLWIIVTAIDGATGSPLLPALVRTARVLGFSHPEWQAIGLWLAFPIMGVVLLFSSFWERRR